MNFFEKHIWGGVAHVLYAFFKALFRSENIFSKKSLFGPLGPLFWKSNHVDWQRHVVWRYVCRLGVTAFWPKMTKFWGKNCQFLDVVSSRPKMLPGMSCQLHVAGNVVSPRLSRKCLLWQKKVCQGQKGMSIMLL